MAPAVDRVAAFLSAVAVDDPRVPLVSGTSAEPLTTGDEVVRALVDGVLAPVRWREVQLRLAALDVTDVVEVGPGGVLAGLARRTVPDLTVHAVAEPADVAAVADRLQVAAG
jgi:[acyl-carrier-protein] S-malonyltransferase